MRRSLRPVVLTALATGAVAPAQAQIFTNNTPITISDPSTVGFADPYPATIVVSGMTGTVTDVDVSLSGFRHTFPDDVDILLVGPSGAATLVISDAGGGTDVNGINIAFDDEALSGQPVPDGGPMTAGTFRPFNYEATPDSFPAPAPAPPGPVSLTIFDTTDPNGTWSLYVVDDAGAEVGRLDNGFQIRITTTLMAPTVFSSNAAVRIHDRWGFGNPNPSQIVVSGAGNTIVTMAVTLHNVTHPIPDELDFLLVGPTGTTFAFATDAGGLVALNNVTFTLDDDAATVLPDSGPITNNGGFRPGSYVAGVGEPDTFRATPLPPYNQAAPTGGATFTSLWAGTNPNGTWSLYVSDDGIGNTGTIAGGWSIDFVLTPVELIDFRIE
jgi:subtilisin-like proprotein convertase family protein